MHRNRLHSAIHSLGTLALAMLGMGYTVSACTDAQAGDPGTGGAGSGCKVAVLCDGSELVGLDTCNQAKTPLTTCPKGCHQGQCVDCVPDAGQLCVGNDVYPIDSCGNQGKLQESCVKGCASGSCVADNCTPNASKQCIGDTVFSLDSCGNLENAEQVCAAGCDSGACKSCTPNTSTACFDGNIYSVDSCQGLGAKVQDCPDACEFSAGSAKCVSNSACTKNNSLQCFLGDIHWVDSCGNVQPEISEDCPSGCNKAGCLPCVPAPTGKTCVGKAVHEIVGGCPGAPPVTGNKLEDCEHGCQNGACLPTACVPGVGKICVGNAVHSADSCGNPGTLLQTCPVGGGCTQGTCTAGEGGLVETCSCDLVEGAELYLSCETGITKTECGGCLWGEGTCPNPTLCDNSCLGELQCSDGAVILSPDRKVGNCYKCPSTKYSECFNAKLCNAVCPPLGE